MSFFIRADLEKFSITPFAYQWILWHQYESPSITVIHKSSINALWSKNLCICYKSIIKTLAYKLCLICAYFWISWFRLDNLLTGESNIMIKYFSWKQHFEIKNILMMNILQTQSFSIHKTLIDRLESCFYPLFELHSDGTHSLQGIHW